MRPPQSFDEAVDLAFGDAANLAEDPHRSPALQAELVGQGLERAGHVGPFVEAQGGLNDDLLLFRPSGDAPTSVEETLPHVLPTPEIAPGDSLGVVWEVSGLGYLPETLDFEMNVDGLVSSGGLGGPAILPQSLAKMSQMTSAFPDKAFSGIGGISTFAHALNYFLLGCGTVQVCTAAMLDRAIGPNVIKGLIDGMQQFMDKRGYTSLEDLNKVRRTLSQNGIDANLVKMKDVAAKAN